MNVALPESDELIGLLPHRPPFLFIDAVDAYLAGVSITARYRVKGDEAFLEGHFPDNPVFPGVIQLEALAQAGAIAFARRSAVHRQLPLFGGVEKVRFRRLVRPGDELLLEVELDQLSARGGWGVARATVDGAATAQARLFFALG